MACIYIIAQLIGSFMGYGMLMILTPASILKISGASICVTKPHLSVTPYQAIAIEFIATMIFVWICCSIWDPRNARYHDSIAIKLGFGVTAIASATVCKIKLYILIEMFIKKKKI